MTAYDPSSMDIYTALNEAEKPMGVTAIARAICARRGIDCAPATDESAQAALRRAIRVHEIRSLLVRGMLGADAVSRYADEWRPSWAGRRNPKLWTSAPNARRWDGASAVSPCARQPSTLVTRES